jgi:hypothetical protein
VRFDVSPTGVGMVPHTTAGEQEQGEAARGGTTMSKNSSVLKTINEIRKLTTGELREKYAEVFGEATSSRNKEYLFRKIAAAIQERAAEKPVNAASTPAATASAGAANTRKVRTPRAPGARDPRLPAPGTVIEREHDGKTIRVKVLEDGFEFRGKTYRSLSAVAREASGTIWNGLLFFHLIPYAKRDKAA